MGKTYKVRVIGSNTPKKAFGTILALIDLWEHISRSGESANLPTLWPGFDSRTWRYIWVFYGSRPCSEGFSPGPTVFHPLQIPTFPIPVWPGNSKHEEPPRGMSTTTFPSLFPCHYSQVRSPLTSASLWSSVLISNPSIYGCRTSSVNTSLCILKQERNSCKNSNSQQCLK